jgi:hypothetical protein
LVDQALNSVSISEPSDEQSYDGGIRPVIDTSGLQAQPDQIDASPSSDASSAEVAPEAASVQPVVDFALPKVAALYFGDKGTETQQRDVARYNFVITGLSGGLSNKQDFIYRMRQVNPSMKLAQYTNIVDIDSNPSPTSEDYLAAKAVHANNWWLRDASGDLTRWTSNFGTYKVNHTAWTARDRATGLRWPEWMAKHETSLLSGLTGRGYIYVDNVWYQPRGPAGDWKLNGTFPSNGELEIASAHRQGLANYWNALRTRMPGKKIIGNVDNYNDLSFPEYKDQLKGAFLECMIGKSWSLELKRGWAFMMQH